MRGRIIRACDLIPPFGDDLVVMNDDGPERPAITRLHVPSSQPDGMSQEVGVWIHSKVGGTQ